MYVSLFSCSSMYVRWRRLEPSALRYDVFNAVKCIVMFEMSPRADSLGQQA